MTTQTNLRGRKYSGVLYARKWGSKDGFVKMGNVTDFSTKAEVEKDELKSTGRDDYGQALEVEITPKPIEISLSFNTFDKYALARILMGEAIDLSGIPQNIDETPVRAAKGWIKLGVLDIDPDNFELKNQSKTTIEKEKYKLNTRTGSVMLLETAGIDDGQTLYFTGKTKGRKGFSIDANTLQSIPLEIYLDGKDRVTENDGVLEIAHVVLSSSGDINWFDDGWWEGGLTGIVVKDEGKPVMRFTEFVG